MGFSLTQDIALASADDFAALVLFEVKRLLKIEGWVVAGSGDGIATFLNGAPGTSRDVITVAGSGANGINNSAADRSGCSGSWFWIHTPPSAETFQAMLWWRARNNTGVDGANWRVELTLDAAGFQSGAPSATEAPQATNHVTLAGSQTRSGFSQEFRAFAPNGANNGSGNILVGDIDDRFSWMFFVVRLSLNRIQVMFGMDGAFGCYDDELDRFVYLLGHIGGSSTTAPIGGYTDFSTSPFFRGDPAAVDRLEDSGATANGPGIFSFRGPNWPPVNTPEEGTWSQGWPNYTVRDAFGSQSLQQGAVADAIEGRFTSLPFIYANTISAVAAAGRYQKGYSGNIFRQPPRQSVVISPNSQLWQDEQGELWLENDNLIFRWPSTTLPDLGGGSTPGAVPMDLALRPYTDLIGTEGGAAILRYVNRVFDLVAGAFVRWSTLLPDPSGSAYPGPDAFGNTLDYCVEVQQIPV